MSLLISLLLYKTQTHYFNTINGCILYRCNNIFVCFIQLLQRNNCLNILNYYMVYDEGPTYVCMYVCMY